MELYLTSIAGIGVGNITVHAGSTRTGGSEFGIGNLFLQAAKALTFPITDILSCLYPCTNITMSPPPKKACEGKYIIETLLY